MIGEKQLFRPDLQYNASNNRDNCREREVGREFERETETERRDDLFLFWRVIDKHIVKTFFYIQPSPKSGTNQKLIIYACIDILRLINYVYMLGGGGGERRKGQI